jgi:hypothetical protein
MVSPAKREIEVARACAGLDSCLTRNAAGARQASRLKLDKPSLPSAPPCQSCDTAFTTVRPIKNVRTIRTLPVSVYLQQGGKKAPCAIDRLKCQPRSKSTESLRAYQPTLSFSGVRLNMSAGKHSRIATRGITLLDDARVSLAHAL